MSDRNFTQRFDVVMTSLSSDKKITVQRCYIRGERCDCPLTCLFKQIVSRGWNRLLVQARCLTNKRKISISIAHFYFEMFIEI